jgi:Family of unknown function (DUF5829)
VSVRGALTLCAVMAATSTPPIVAQQTVPLVLNHLEVVLDSATFRDLRASPFLREQFAAVDTVEDVLFYGLPGMRLFGRYNHITFANPRKAPVGDVAIVLSSEMPGALETLARGGKLKLSFRAPGATDARLMRRDYLRGTMRVASLTGPDSTTGHTHFEIMQYDQGDSKMLASVDSLPVSNLANSRFLAPYFDPHKLLAYVSSATLAIPTDDIAKIVGVLNRDGVTVYTEGEGAIIKLDGFTLHLIPPWAGAGVKQLQFALTRDVPANPVYRFGPRSQLRFGPGPIAVWDFGAR